ncbi:MAG: hypothetical protein GF408_04425 [Candidatus Omnitrophica bacterium]|nr:hypothetical protein [Candidatus Omnitrophota bacterium]
MKKILLFLVFLFYAGAAGAAAENDPGEMFREANELYQKGDYGEAIRKYENILVSGTMSGPLYFNLGNAYFRKGELGLSILNYMRAGLMIPRDADLRANLSFARSGVLRKVPREEGIWGFKPIEFLLDNFTVNELTFAVSGLFILVLICLLAASYTHSFRKYPVWAAVLFALGAVVLTAVISHKARVNSREAVVLQPDVEAKFGPFASGGKFFSLSEGMDVQVLYQKEGWAKIMRSDGKIGWVRDTQIEKVMGAGGA